MRFYIGVLVVLGSVLIGNLGAGGHLGVLWQPFEYLIILGSAAGAFAISNPPTVVSRVLPNVKKIIDGPKYQKKDYLELLGLIFSIFRLAKSKGMLSLEPHIENPHDSAIFQKFPSFLYNQKALSYMCDSLRLLTMGSDDVHKMDDLMSEELEVILSEDTQDVTAIEKMADGLPALGIVAAVLGVIHTMGSISQPPEVLGHLIGGALVGTFVGILVSYGFVSPMAQSLKHVMESDQQYMICIKTSVIAYLNGYAPIIVAEYSRKILDSHNRPSFSELENITQQMSEEN